MQNSYHRLFGSRSIRAALAVAVFCIAAGLATPSRTKGAQAQPPASLTLAQAVALAVQRNPQVRIAQANVQAADARVRAVSVRQTPTVGLSASGDVGSGTTSGVAVSTTVSYLVYDGGVIQAQIRQAQAQALAARQALLVARNDVALQAVQAFVGVVGAEQLIAVREQSLAQARTQLQAAQAGVRAGTVPQADVIRAESQVARADFDLVDAQGQVENRRGTLRALLVLEPAAPVAAASPGAPPTFVVAEAEAVQQSLQRPEIQRAEAETQASEAALAVAMLEGGITVTVDGRYVLVGTTGSGPGSWSVGPSLSFPLFDGGRRAAAVEEARANLDAARERLGQTRITVRQEAQQNVTQFRSAQARYTAAVRAAEAAREALRVAEGRYRAGVGTLIEVTTARTDQITAEVALLQADIDRWTALASLRRAVALSVLP